MCSLRVTEDKVVIAYLYSGISHRDTNIES